MRFIPSIALTFVEILDTVAGEFNQVSIDPHSEEWSPISTLRSRITASHSRKQPTFD